MHDTKWWTIALSIVAAVIIASALALIHVPGWIVESTFSEYREQGQTIQQTALVNATSSARQTVTLGIGGIIAIVTFVLSLAKHRVTKQEHALEQQKQELENAKHAREQEKHAQDRDSLWATRYSEAITQFSNTDSDTTRLAGIYSLERIAQESQNDRQPILEVLCAYLRENCRSNLEQVNGSATPLNEVTKTAREVMTRIVKMSPPPRLDLAQVDLTETSFAGAIIYHANFSKADLTDAIFEDADLSYANLFNAELKGTNLRNAKLIHTNIGATTLSDTDIRDADCTGILAYATVFINANLRRTNLTNAKLRISKIINSDLTNANLSHAALDKTEIKNSDISYARFFGTSINGTHFNHVYTYFDTHPDSYRPVTLKDLSQTKYDPTTPPQINS